MVNKSERIEEQEIRPIAYKIIDLLKQNFPNKYTNHDVLVVCAALEMVKLSVADAAGITIHAIEERSEELQ